MHCIQPEKNLQNGAGGGLNQSSASPCGVPQIAALRLGTCSAIYL